MIKRFSCVLIFLSAFFLVGFSQSKDTSYFTDGRMISLTPVVVSKGLDVASFTRRVIDDTSFYKAFKNLRVLNYSMLNDVRMFDRKGRVEASMSSKTDQWASHSCRVTQWLNEETSGEYYKPNGECNYYTGELYSSLFFSRDTVCGESNVIKDIRLSIHGKTGLAKNKEQLKMLFFNPGKDIPGIPLMGNKVQMFDPEHSDLYDMIIDIQDYKGKAAYVFSSKAKEDLSFFKRDNIVIDEMITWFDYSTFEIMARNYKMSYNAGVYKFNVSMEVEIAKYGKYLYPSVIRYDGYWGVMTKGKERGLFTATIFEVH